jgi:type VI secretion system secreted protein VgrG
MLNGLPTMTGIVKEIGSDEDKLNKIKVTIPILDDVELQARIGYPIAGPEYGFVWAPDVGQEVLLAFPYGEINQPIIICAMYNEKNKPPKELTKENQDIYYKSKTGNEFTFHDEEDKSKIEITTKKGHQLIYDDDQETLTIQSK